MSKVVTRFAPSPTGTLHIGGVRTALFNYIYAKQNNGEFLVRIEDTDRERSTKAFEKNILDTLSSIGLSPDKKPINQSERNRCNDFRCRPNCAIIDNYPKINRFWKRC